MKRVLSLVALFACLLTLAPAVATQEAATRERKSSFGVYEGYGEPTYDGYLRESFYVAMRDGVELAVDLYRPTLNEEVHTEALPLVWTHNRYHRAAQGGEGGIPTMLFGYYWMRTLLNHGYLVASVDVRGGGASFGTWSGIFNEEETKDAYELIEWFADQEWCDGNIGMYGGSYLGGTQFMAASQKSPHLKALFPFVAPIDMYEIAWSGGIYRDDLCTIWGDLTHQLDRSMAVASVDWDDGNELKKAALKEHEGNRPFEPVVRALPYRNSEHEGKPLWLVQSPLTYAQQVQESGVAIYHQGGWFDPFSRDAFLMYGNLENPQKVVLGPWFHTQSFGLDWNAEARRWYDYWLKDIDNGVMDDPPIHYFTMGAPEGEEWRATHEWPLPNEKRVAYYFHPGPSGSIASVNDGLLSQEQAAAGVDEYKVDYGASSGRVTRWNNAVGVGGGNPAYMDLQENDARCLTYTTPVLEQDLEITGHPVAHLWVTIAGADDGDFFVYLEEVTSDGTSEYVTEGCLRATHRALAQPAHDPIGLPYHTCEEADVTPIPRAPMELVFDLFPVSNLFDAGNRLRITVACADDENALTPAVDPAPTVTLHRGGERASYVELPVIPVGE